MDSFHFQDRGDPGIVIILNSDSEVHTALGLPAVAALNPSLQQGKTFTNSIYQALNLCPYRTHPSCFES